MDNSFHEQESRAQQGLNPCAHAAAQPRARPAPDHYTSSRG